MVEIKFLKKTFPLKKTFFGRVKTEISAVNDININFPAHKITGIVGESGSGKSTLARLLCGIYKPQGGYFVWKNFKSNSMTKADWKNYRRNVQMVFQDPFSSLNPRMKIRKILEEPFVIHEIDKRNKEAVNKKISGVLSSVGLSDESLDKYPHEFSGGQRQRIAIARALVLEPDVVIFDEAVSALDVSIQAQILNLVLDIQTGRKMTGIFIAHDLSVISYVSDFIAVMYGGKLVEFNTRDEIFNRPRHPYTKLLLKSIPIVGQPLDEKLYSGETVDVYINREGCPFYYRCEKKMPVCEKNYPEKTIIKDDFFYECYNPYIPEDPDSSFEIIINPEEQEEEQEEKEDLNE